MDTILSAIATLQQQVLMTVDCIFETSDAEGWNTSVCKICNGQIVQTFSTSGAEDGEPTVTQVMELDPADLASYFHAYLVTLR